MANTGVRYSYTDTTHGKRSISDVLWFMDWQEAPLLNLLGMDAQGKFNLVNWPQRKAELIEDTMVPLSTTLDEALDGSETDWDVTDGTIFRQGDIVGIEDANGDIAEKGLVTSVASNTITVQARGYGSTSATTHSSGATIKVLTRAMPEANDFTTGPTTSVSTVYNYVQLFSEAVKVSKTEVAISGAGGYYAIGETMAYQVSKLFNNNGRAGRLPRMLEATFYYGERVERTSSAYGSMGGFETFVTTNVTNLSQAEITRKDIHQKIREIHDANGRADLLITSSIGKEKIAAMYEGSVRTTRDETRGGTDIMTIMTPLGEVEVVWGGDQCPSDRYYFVDRTRVGWFPLRSWATNAIAEQGDYYVTDVVGEYTFMVANEESHGIIKGAKRT